MGLLLAQESLLWTSCFSWCFLVVVDVPVLLVVSPAGGVCPPVLPPVWANARAPPSTRVQAIANSFFILSPLKGSSECYQNEHAARKIVAPCDGPPLPPNTAKCW